VPEENEVFVPVTNGLKPKPDGRIGTLERRVTELEAGFTELIATLAWLTAEKEYQAKVAIALQLLQTPEVQEKLKAALVTQMTAQGQEISPDVNAQIDERLKQALALRLGGIEA
jgi:hypothetical protein